MSRQLTVYPCQYPGCHTDIESLFNCPRKYCDAHRVIARRKYQRLRARLRLRLNIEKKCVRCGGKITKSYNKRYCTKYCYWMNDLKNHNKYLKRQEALVRVD